jgi:hypothetical protein
MMWCRDVYSRRALVGVLVTGFGVGLGIEVLSCGCRYLFFGFLLGSMGWNVVSWLMISKRGFYWSIV